MRFLFPSLIAVSSLLMLAPKSTELYNTTWTGKLNVPEPMDAEMEFRKDSLFTYIGQDLVETNLFKVNGDTLVLQKLSGMSTCDLQPAAYKFSISADVLKLEALNENCDERKAAFSPEGYKKLK